MIETVTNIDYLIDPLRIQLGDYTDPVRYTDAMLRTTLVAAIEVLERWWNYKYLVDDTTYNVFRNPNVVFLFADPPLIQHGDKRIIILMCSLIVKGGQLENSSYSVGSWRDNEISYSNIESSRMKDSSWQRDWDELTELIKPPSKKLSYPVKNSLRGYLNNPYEN